MRSLTPPLNRVRFCVFVARELFIGADVNGEAFSQARIIGLLDVVAAKLPELASDQTPDADELAHNYARILEFTCRLLTSMRFLDWSAGEAIFALIATGSAELDMLSEVFERQQTSGTALVPA